MAVKTHERGGGESGSSSRVSSYDIFMRFVKNRNDDSSSGPSMIDVSGILSKECYETWLLSRVQSMEYPEKSFQTALLGHIAGTSRRKPFEPEIEKALLSELRKKQVWACFRNTDCSIGIHGIRKKGYHESRGLGIASKEKVKQEKRRVSTKDTTSKKSETARYLKSLKTGNVPGSSYSAGSSCGSFTDSYGSRGADISSFTGTTGSSTNSGAEKNMFSQPDDYLDFACDFEQANQIDAKRLASELVLLSKLKPVTPSRRLAMSLLGFFETERNLLTFLESIHMDGNVCLGDPLYCMLDLNPGDDKRLQNDFLFPPQVNFYESLTDYLLTGTLLLDDNLVIMQAQGNIEQVLKQSCVLKNWADLCAFKLQMAVILSSGLPLLKASGMLQIQRVVMSKDGIKLFVFRETVQRNPVSGYTVTVQDVSEKYQDVLSLPKLFI
mmetsp:Transcript_32028/g.39441  ORF Transcript_32028/g.39441 Transcript_32028/m.39441 type:complete len:439 (-) Transcript_32028:144-1460(-)